MDYLAADRPAGMGIVYRGSYQARSELNCRLNDPDLIRIESTVIRQTLV
jgi:hypothetical protein